MNMKRIPKNIQSIPVNGSVIGQDAAMNLNRVKVKFILFPRDATSI